MSFSNLFLQRRKDAPVFAAVFIVVLFFAGCQMEPEDSTGNLHGVWINIYRDPGGEYPDFETTIIIDTENKTIEYTDSYNAIIVNSPDFSSAYGVLIIQFTKYGDWGEEPTTEHSNAGSYGAFYWRDLGINSVRMADAYEEWNHALAGTPEEAQEKFTNDKAGDYIDWSIVGIYTK
ncbi:MAG: hypothetical protein FWD40_03110 [Treponema sp.]|nr:hypothetical protein [Treponema sp.]